MKGEHLQDWLDLDEQVAYREEMKFRSLLPPEAFNPPERAPFTTNLASRFYSYSGEKIWHQYANLSRVVLPYEIPHRPQMAHWLLCAPSDVGKTETLEHIVLYKLAQTNPPSIVLLDSKGDLFERLCQLECFAPGGRLYDRLVIIDPRLYPALSLFQLKSWQTEADALEGFEYIFSAMGTDFTGLQTPLIEAICKLLLKIPDATIRDMRLLFSEKNALAIPRYAEALELVHRDTREYLSTQLVNVAAQSRTGIINRLAKIEGTLLTQMWSAPSNEMDWYTQLQMKGAIVLVNTSETLLKEGGSALFGRYIISQVIQGCLARQPIDDDKRRPTFLVLDEAKPYIDKTADRILTRLRQYGLTSMWAFQDFAQVPADLRHIMLSQTSVKMATQVGADTAKALMNDMRCAPTKEGDFGWEYLQNQPRKDYEYLNWALYVRGMKRPMSVYVPMGTGRNANPMSAEEYETIIKAKAELLQTKRVVVNEQAEPAPKQPTRKERRAKQHGDIPPSKEF